MIRRTNDNHTLRTKITRVFFKTHTYNITSTHQLRSLNK